MEDTSATRVRRIQQLIDTRFEGNRAAMARASKKSPAMLWQYVSGYRAIGEKAAREIEQALRLPRGWLDTQPAENEDETVLDPGRTTGRTVADTAGVYDDRARHALEALAERMARRSYTQDEIDALLRLVDVLGSSQEGEGG